MPTLVAITAYFLLGLCYFGALLLVLEWLVHSLPGAWLNFARRALFKISFPFLSWSDRYMAFETRTFRARGLLTAMLLIVIGKYGVPWLILVSFSLRS